MKQRKIWLVVLLTIVTIGIYYIVWSTFVQQEIYSKTKKGFEWPLHIILTFVTFGFYLIYWAFAMGNRLQLVGAKNNNDIWFCLLSIFLLNIVNIIWMQKTINGLK